ncbi:DUF5988 family protein [Streptomyces sp. NBC_01187]|uniref:DUF5988 family protein n=1 Tax=Streptomyces sp. NBC_01187 TaxID=2903766 RepID=UPI00386EAFAD
MIGCLFRDFPGTSGGFMDTYVRVILKGGPDGIPRIREVAYGDEIPHVKVACGNGYEHFERTGDHEEFEGEILPVYQWSYRTFIAE